MLYIYSEHKHTSQMSLLLQVYMPFGSMNQHVHVFVLLFPASRWQLFCTGQKVPSTVFHSNLLDSYT